MKRYHMKIKGVLILLFAIVVSAGAQTNRIITFTNRFATFTDLRGRVYEGVELVRADFDAIIYLTPTGGGQVYYTNLAPKTLQEFGIPTNRIELAALRAEARRQQRLQAALEAQAEEARERERFLNESNWIQVKIDYADPASLSVHGGIRICWIRTESGSRSKVYVRRLPYQVSAYYARRQTETQAVNELAARLSARSAQLKQEEYQWRLADVRTAFYAWGDPAYVNTLAGERLWVNQWRIQLDAKQQQLVEMQKELEAAQKKLAELNAAESEQTTVRAFVTRSSYYGIPILECAPEPP